MQKLTVKSSGSSTKVMNKKTSIAYHELVQEVMLEPFIDDGKLFANAEFYIGGSRVITTVEVGLRKPSSRERATRLQTRPSAST